MATGFVIVPQGWQRDVMDGRVSYKSPDMKILKSREELLIHLTSDGTCKCGLRCPFQFEEQFSFDPHVLSLPDNGIPSVIQASCKVGHALRDLMSKPGGAREPRGEKVSTMEGSVSEPKLHRHRSRSRSHRKKPSGKRMPENENEGNGNAIVPTARAVLLSTSEKAEKNSARQAKSDGKQSDIVKTSVLESPTRPQDAAASSWSPDMNVRRLLTQLPGNSSPTLQQGMRVEERKLSENAEDRQKPSKVTLRLFQKQKESKVQVSEKQSLALSAVLTGRTISELTRKSGRGMTQGGGEVDVGEEAREGETECELTVSIKLGESEGQKGVEDEEMQSKRDDPLQLTTSDGAEAEDSDLPKDSQSVLGEPGNGGMEVLESDSGNHECLNTNNVISTEMHVASITENPSQVSSPSLTSSDDGQSGSQLSEAVPAIQSLQSHTNQVAPPPSSLPPTSPPSSNTRPTPSNRTSTSSLLSYTLPPGPGVAGQFLTSPPSSNTRPTPSNHLLGSVASTSTSSLLSYTLPPGPGVAGQFLSTPTDFLPPSSSVPYTPYPLQSSPTKDTSPSLSTFVVEHSSPPTPSTNLPSLPHVEPQTTSRIPPPPYPSCARITPMNSGPVNPQSFSSSQPLSAKTGSKEVSTLPDSEQPQPLPLQFHAEAGDLSLVLSSQPDVVDVAHGSQEEEVENGMEQNVSSLDRLISELCGMEVEGNGSVNGALQLLASEDSQVTSAVIDDDHHGNFSPISAHSTLGSDGAVQGEVYGGVSEWFQNETQAVGHVREALAVKQNGARHLGGGDGVAGPNVAGGGGVAMMTSDVHVPFSPKVASEIKNGIGSLQSGTTEPCPPTAFSSEHISTSLALSPHHLYPLTRLPLRLPPKRDPFTTSKLTAHDHPTDISSGVGSLLSSHPRVPSTLKMDVESSPLNANLLTAFSEAVFSNSPIREASSDTSAASASHTASDDSLPLSELSSLTPDSHIGPSSSIFPSPLRNLSASMPVPSLLRQVRTPQFGGVPIKECRIELKPIGREWTPRKRHFSECDVAQREEELKGGEQLEVMGCEMEDAECAGLMHILHPKRLRFSELLVERKDEEEKMDVSSDPLPDIQPIDRLLHDSPPSAETVNPELFHPASYNPEIVQPASYNPEIVQSTSSNPEIIQPMSANPEIVQPLSSSTEIVQPSSYPEIVQPVSGIAQAESANPEIAQLVSANPEIAQPVSVNPEIVQPASTNPEIAHPNIPTLLPQHTSTTDTLDYPTLYEQASTVICAMESPVVTDSEVIATSPITATACSTASVMQYSATSDLSSSEVTGNTDSISTSTELNDTVMVENECRSGANDGKTGTISNDPKEEDDSSFRGEESDSMTVSVSLEVGGEDRERKAKLSDDLETLAAVADSVFEVECVPEGVKECTPEQIERETQEKERTPEQIEREKERTPEDIEREKGRTPEDIEREKERTPEDIERGPQEKERTPEDIEREKERTPEDIEREKERTPEDIEGKKASKKASSDHEQTLLPAVPGPREEREGEHIEKQSAVPLPSPHSTPSVESLVQIAPPELIAVEGQTAPSLMEVSGVSVRSVATTTDWKSVYGGTGAEEESVEKVASEGVSLTEEGNEVEVEGKKDRERDKGGEKYSTGEEFGWLHILAQVAIEASPKVDVKRRDPTPVGKSAEKDAGPSLQAEDTQQNRSKLGGGLDSKEESKEEKKATEEVSRVDVSSGASKTISMEASTSEKPPPTAAGLRTGKRKLRVWGRSVGVKSKTARRSEKKLSHKTNVSVITSTEESMNVDVMEVSGTETKGRFVSERPPACSKVTSDVRECQREEGTGSAGQVKASEGKGEGGSLERECGGVKEEDLQQVKAEDVVSAALFAQKCMEDPHKPLGKSATQILDDKGTEGQSSKENERSEPLVEEDIHFNTQVSVITSYDTGLRAGSNSGESVAIQSGGLEQQVKSDCNYKSHDTGQRSGDAGALGTDLKVAMSPPEKKVKICVIRRRGGRRRRGRGRFPGREGGEVSVCEGAVVGEMQTNSSEAEVGMRCGGMEPGPSGMDSEQDSVEIQTNTKDGVGEQRMKLDADIHVDTNSVSKYPLENSGALGNSDTKQNTPPVETSEALRGNEIPHTSMASPSRSSPMASPAHPIPTKHYSFHTQADALSTSETCDVPLENLRLTVSVPLSEVEVVHYHSFQCYSASQFQSGDVVWAKAAQLPGWPGAVINHNEWKRNKLKAALPGKRWVKWFGDDTVSLVNEKSMKPLSEGLKRRMQRKTTKGLQRAISLALKAQRKKEKQQS